MEIQNGNEDIKLKEILNGINKETDVADEQRQQSDQFISDKDVLEISRKKKFNV